MSSDSTDPDIDPTDPDTTDPDPDTIDPDPAPKILDEEQDEDQDEEQAKEKAEEPNKKPNKEQDKEEVSLESKIINSMIVLYNKRIGTDKDIIKKYGTRVTVTTYSSLNL